jgi:hypothetical protein
MNATFSFWSSTLCRIPAPITGTAFDAMEAGAGRRERTAAASRVARGVQIDGLYQAQGPLEGGEAAGGLENCIPLAVALHRLLVLLSCGFCELRTHQLRVCLLDESAPFARSVLRHCS